jgi:hypothetical protein
MMHGWQLAEKWKESAFDMFNIFESMLIRVSNSAGAENNKDDEKIAEELYGRN